MNVSVDAARLLFTRFQKIDGEWVAFTSGLTSQESAILFQFLQREVVEEGRYREVSMPPEVHSAFVRLNEMDGLVRTKATSYCLDVLRDMNLVTCTNGRWTWAA